MGHFLIRFAKDVAPLGVIRGTAGYRPTGSFIVLGRTSQETDTASPFRQHKAMVVWGEAPSDLSCCTWTGLMALPVSPSPLLDKACSVGLSEDSAPCPGVCDSSDRMAETQGLSSVLGSAWRRL